MKAMRPWILFTVLVAVPVGRTSAVAQNHSPETNRESGLVFVIEPVKTVYTKGENVEFKFRLSNRSDEKVLVAKTFQLARYVDLNISDAKGKLAGWCGRIVSQTDSPRSFTTLSPGESVSQNLVVSCVNETDRTQAWGYSLDTPGRYLVTGTYRLPQPSAFFEELFPKIQVVRGPVSAKPVSIEIR